MVAICIHLVQALQIIQTWKLSMKQDQLFRISGILTSFKII